MISGKGYSPQNFVCFSYGGAGPVHAYGYTEGLGFEDVIVPAWAAGFSAFGCAAADFEYRYDKSLDINLAPDADKGSGPRRRRWCRRHGGADEERLGGVPASTATARAVRLQPGYRMQFRGQLNDLEVESPLPSASDADDWDNWSLPSTTPMGASMPRLPARPNSATR